VTLPFSVREGINIFLAGFIPTENLRFRDEELNFQLTTSTGTIYLFFLFLYLIYVRILELYDSERISLCTYPSMTKTMGTGEQSFKLHVEGVSC
jgi:ATP-binding cassette subfamily E protein 1